MVSHGMVWCPLPREGPHPAGRCHQSILVITLHVSAHVICLKRKISHKGFKSWGSLQYFFSFSETFKLSGWTGRVGSPSTKERQLLWLRSNSSSNRYKCTFAIGVLKRIELWINAIWGQRQVKDGDVSDLDGGGGRRQGSPRAWTPRLGLLPIYHPQML